MRGRTGAAARSAPAHASVFEPPILLAATLLAALGAVIGAELITRVGIAPNSSVIGAIVAIGLARIPFGVFGRFRSVERQNLLQTAISAATFGAANGMLLPLAVVWLVGDAGLVPPMLLGALLGLVIDATMVYSLFDTRAYPASGAWPAGLATAETIRAGDEGGRRARLLGLGALAGGSGQLVGLPMDIVGVCWVGNRWALAAFAAGLLLRAYAGRLAGVDLEARHVPHGIMIGAGAVALVQIATVLRRGARGASTRAAARRDDRGPSRTLGAGLGAFVLAAAVLAVASGVAARMTAGELARFVAFAAVAALVSELVVGISAMHAGWFPAFATTLVFLLLGLGLGLAPVPLALLAGFVASTGPAFADMGYDLKAGWILRGEGARPDYEAAGRREQYLTELVGFLVAGALVFAFHARYFEAGLLPPVARVFAATIEAGTSAALARDLLAWAAAGALLQLAGGSSRQLGILFATGLLIEHPVAGWTAAAALLVRAVVLRRRGPSVEGPLSVLAGGLIAGSALASFGAATVRAR